MNLLYCVMLSVILNHNADLSKIDSVLCKIGEDDQRVRSELIDIYRNATPQDLYEFKKKMDSIDVQNQEYVAKLLDETGWPDGLSNDANRAIFLVIDHANNEYAKKYFPYVEEKSELGILQKSDVATLGDRILMRSGLKQKYGTQTVNLIRNDESVIYVWPIENPEEVDKLRTLVGLPPMSEYILLIEKTMGNKVVWDKNLLIKDI